MGGTDDDKAPASESAVHDDTASESSCYATDEEDSQIQLGPKISIKEHLEKDKDYESLRKWKEQLLGSVDVSQVEEDQEPDVKILSLAIISPGRPDIVLEIPNSGNPKAPWFTLKEGSKYNLKFSIKVCNDIVCGLKYTNHVWKTGLTLFCFWSMFRWQEKSIGSKRRWTE